MPMLGRLVMSNFVELYSGNGGSWYFIKVSQPHQERLHRPRGADPIGPMVGTIDSKNGCYTLKLTGFDTSPQEFETKRDAETVLSAHIALIKA